MDKIRILLADDHTVLREGIRALLNEQPDMAVVGEVEDGRWAVHLAHELRPHVVLMDIACPCSMAWRPLARSNAITLRSGFWF